MQEKEFEREVLDRLIAIETQLKAVATQCPTSQEKVHALEIEQARMTESIKSSHHRIDGVYKTVAWIAGAITLLINVLAFVFDRVGR